MMVMILIMAFPSCKTFPTEIDLVWTTPPNPIVNGVSVVKFDKTTKEVIMPISYWRKIIVYIADTERNIEILNNIK